MLRKRTRSHQKDQHKNHMKSDAISESYLHSDTSGQKHKSNSYFNVPGLFVGFNPKNSESDSVRSPTSPLDFRIFSSLGNPFRCSRSPNEGHQKIWDCSKVGLSIIDSLDVETKQSGKIIQSSNSKNILFGRQMNVKSLNFCSQFDSLKKPKSLPKNVAVFPNAGAKPASAQKDDSGVLFEIGEVPFEACENFRSFSLDSGRCKSRLSDFGNRKSNLGSGNLVPENTGIQMPSNTGSIEGSLKLGNSSGGTLSSIPTSIHPGTSFISSIPASEIELSEDYTCVRIHGPNPKVTHIFGDYILECDEDDLTNFFKKSEDGTPSPKAAGNSDVLASYPPIDFLKFCYSCKKNLEGEDIFMYRGEKAFCSWSCRSQEILNDEEMEKTNNNSSGENPNNSQNSCVEIF